MTEFQITASNDFNAGWLAYVLGLPNDENRSPIWRDGWDTGRETSSLDAMRYVMEKQRTLAAPQYVVTEVPDDPRD